MSRLLHGYFGYYGIPESEDEDDSSKGKQDGSYEDYPDMMIVSPFPY